MIVNNQYRGFLHSRCDEIRNLNLKSKGRIKKHHCNKGFAWFGCYGKFIGVEKYSWRSVVTAITLIFTCPAYIFFKQSLTPTEISQ
jgi:hypothetical protein